MSESFQEVLDAEGNTVCRIVYNPSQPPNSLPWWLEVADGYSVQEGKQGCHDRREVERLAVRRK